MRTDLKIGIILGLFVILGVVVYFGIIVPNMPTTTDQPTGSGEDAGQDGEQFNTLDPLAGMQEQAEGTDSAGQGTGSKTVDLGFLGKDSKKTDTPPGKKTDDVVAGADKAGDVIDPVLEPVGEDQAVDMGTDGTEKKAPPALASGGMETYIVKEGDQGFWAIAEKHYGDGKYYTLIAKANPDAQSNALRPGQVLKIPPLPKDSKTPNETIIVDDPPQQDQTSTKIKQGTYKVQKGDAGFWGISQKVYKNGKYWTILAKANPSVNSRTLKPGQILIVPPLETRKAKKSGTTESPAFTGQPQTYTVKQGDAGFWGVAEKVYKNGKYYTLIAKANPDADPYNLKPGQKLIIPPLPGSTTRKAQAVAPKPKAAPTPIEDDEPYFKLE